MNFGLDDVTALYFGDSGSAKAYNGEEVVFTGSSEDYSLKYLTFQILSGGTIDCTSNLGGKTISYSKDDGATWTSVGAGDSISVLAGEEVLLKGTNASYGDKVLSSSDVYFNACGNIMSLIYGDNFIGQTAFTENAVFQSFFQDSHLVDASNLILPALQLSQYCYFRMFQGCSSLIGAPALPATSLAPFCYCYIFHSCSSLEKAPVLPALTLPDFAYFQAFYMCYQLKSITCLATDITTATMPTGEWMNQVSSTGVFYKNRNMSGWESGDNGIPNGWTVLNAN